MMNYISGRLTISLLLISGALTSALPRPDSTTTSTSAKVSTVYQFPNGTWLENLDQRRTGQILTTELFTPRLWQLDPRQPATQKPVLIASITEKTGLTGITEISPDVFVVIGGSFTETAVTPKSFSIFKVDLNKTPAAVSKLIDIPDGQLLNGITFVPGAVLKSSNPKGLLLVTDSFAGAIWSVDLATLKAKIWLKDPNTMNACAPVPYGINGIKYNDAEKKVYFANTGCQGGFLASVQLNTNTGSPTGSVTLAGGKTQNVRPDDFDIDQKAKKAYVAASTYDQIKEVNLVSGDSRVVAGVVNSSLIAQPTSVKLGRTKNDVQQGLFYVSTSGLYGDKVTGGQILAICK